MKALTALGAAAGVELRFSSRAVGARIKQAVGLLLKKGITLRYGEAPNVFVCQNPLARSTCGSILYINDKNVTMLMSKTAKPKSDALICVPIFKRKNEPLL